MSDVYGTDRMERLEHKGWKHACIVKESALITEVIIKKLAFPTRFCDKIIIEQNRRNDC